MEFKNVDVGDLKFDTPFSMVISGPTFSGKSFWVYTFLKYMKQIFKNGREPTKVLFCYSVDQELYHRIKKELNFVFFHEGLPEIDEIVKMSRGEKLLVVLDDLVHKIVESQEMLMLFTQVSHHRNVSVIFMTQNIYQSGRHARTIALNVKYIVLFKNPRDSMQIKFLGRQLFPGKGDRLYEAYTDATSRKWGYLLIDLLPGTDEMVILRSLIFPDDANMVVYESK